MEVEIRYGVCNNSPAESTSPENGWSLSARSTPGRQGKCLVPMNRSAAGRPLSGVACHHSPWTAHMVRRHRAWHAIIAFGQHR